MSPGMGPLRMRSTPRRVAERPRPTAEEAGRLGALEGAAADHGPTWRPIAGP